MIDAKENKLEANKSLGQILVVDDEKEIWDYVSAPLIEEGFVCTTAKSTEEASKIIRSKLFDAIITDMCIFQEQKGGMHVLRLATERAIPCVVMTGFAALDVVKEALNLGASYFLEKPFKISELRKVLKEIIKAPHSFRHEVEVFFKKYNFTVRECEISRLMIKGLPTLEIAKITQNSEKTIRNHISNIFRKCDVNSRSEFFSSIFPT